MLSRARNAVPIVALAVFACFGQVSASAATVVNGDFETGNLNGWQIQNSSFVAPPQGNWFAYTGTNGPLSTGFVTLQPPPQGTYAAISDQSGPGTHILYQDIALEPYFAHVLSLTAYYTAHAPIAIPTPDTLNSSGGPSTTTPEQNNEQYRIDLIKPTAPLDTLNPADILTTLFATNAGDPELKMPTVLTANLTPFAGQTVRLRMVEVDNESYLNAGLDSVSLASTPPSNAFSFGKLKLNKKKGTGLLELNLPGAGVVTVKDGQGTAATARASAAKKKKKLIKSASVTAAAAGVVSVAIKPTGAGRKILKKKHKLNIKALVGFTPTGGSTATQTFKGTLRLKAKPKPRK